MGGKGRRWERKFWRRAGLDNLLLLEGTSGCACVSPEFRSWPNLLPAVPPSLSFCSLHTSLSHIFGSPSYLLGVSSNDMASSQPNNQASPGLSQLAKSPIAFVLFLSLLLASIYLPIADAQLYYNVQGDAREVPVTQLLYEGFWKEVRSKSVFGL